MSDRLSYLLTDHTGGLGTIPVRNEKIPRHHLTPGRISATQCMHYPHRYGSEASPEKSRGGIHIIPSLSFADRSG